MRRMFIGSLKSSSPIINLLAACPTGDAIILDTGKTALIACGQIRFQVVEFQIKADVPIEIAVTWIARIAFLPTPYLLGRVKIAAECSHAIGCKNRRKHGITRPRTRVQNPVSISDKPTQVRFFKNIFQSFRISAFRQPNATWFLSKTSRVMISSDQHLRSQGWRMVGQKRKHSMSGSTGDDFK